MREAISSAAKIFTALAGPTPLKRCKSLMLALDKRCKLLSLACKMRRAKSTALSSKFPEPRIMASNSTSVRLFRPFVRSFSRGRSCTDQSLIELFELSSLVRYIYKKLGFPRKEKPNLQFYSTEAYFAAAVFFIN